MRVIDYHMHTHFSGDSEANPREHVLKAIEMNLDEICFTDHRDFDYPIDSFELDVENYYQEIQSLKEEFKDQIKIKWGIEMGLDLDHQEEIENLIQQYPFAPINLFRLDHAILSGYAVLAVISNCYPPV